MCPHKTNPKLVALLWPQKLHLHQSLIDISQLLCHVTKRSKDMSSVNLYLSSWRKSKGIVSVGSCTRVWCDHLGPINLLWTCLLSFDDDMVSFFFFAASIMGHSLFRIALSSAVKSSANLSLLILRYSLFFDVPHRKSLVDLFVKRIIVFLGLVDVSWYLPRWWTMSMSSVIFCWEPGTTAQQMLITLALISSGLPSGTPWSLRFHLCPYRSSSLSLSCSSVICW